MNKLYKLGYSAAASAGALALSASSVFAQTINTNNVDVKDTFGTFTADASLINIFAFAFNLLRWLGWAGVILGVAFAIVALIYKLFNTDNEEAMQTVQGYLTKAVLIVIAGLLLVSAGFIVNFIGNILGFTDEPEFKLEDTVGS